MEELMVGAGDLIIIDPCYIKKVQDRYGSDRYDALRCAKVLFDGDDGEYSIEANGTHVCMLGVDSGRIWAFQAEFSCKVEIDAGLSGYKHFPAGKMNVEDFRVVEWGEDE